jgi:hypothetical protein
MANITTPTNGTYQPVSNMDTGTTATSPGAGWPTPLNGFTSGASVNLAGPKLDFGTIAITGENPLTAAHLNLIIQTVQTKATIAIYEVTNTTNSTVALAIYPTGAWDFTDGGDLDVAITAAVGACTTSASATFTN